jgi:hypothetical protein
MSEVRPGLKGFGGVAGWVGMQVSALAVAASAAAGPLACPGR